MKCIGIILALLVLTFMPVQGMSSCPDDDILIPDEDFKVNLTDIDGVVTAGGYVTFECQTYISAKRGATTIFIPFDRIKTIEMQNNNEVITKEMPEIEMIVTLVDGSQYTSKAMSNQEITGQADFGKFRIRMDHIRKIEFLPHQPDTGSPADAPEGVPSEP
ncbi:MAG TPA: hypothetical protein PLV45_07050 [bacterium]|nr:hypothetical protein [bacterium]